MGSTILEKSTNPLKLIARPMKDILSEAFFGGGHCIIASNFEG